MKKDRRANIKHDVLYDNTPEDIETIISELSRITETSYKEDLSKYDKKTHETDFYIHIKSQDMMTIIGSIAFLIDLVKSLEKK